MFTASQLIPRRRYIIILFEVAAVSTEGAGPFGSGIDVETSVSEGIYMVNGIGVVWLAF